ncbi:MAG: hypothetical protein ACREMS_10495 [Gemmatimonadaceae bacterium]
MTGGGFQMLCFKAWRESRARFLISAGTIAVLCILVIVFNVQIRQNPLGNPAHGHLPSYNEHIYQFVYAGTAKGIFEMLVLFLGLGGLLRERRYGTAAFSLALPVLRMQLSLTRIAVGLLELIALCLLPLVLVPTLSLVMHEYYPVSVSLHFAALWMAGGGLIFSLSYLASVSFAGEYTALMVAFVVLFLIPLAAQVPAIQPYEVNVLQTMGEFGSMHWNQAHTVLLPPAMPWLRAMVFIGISASLLTLSLQITGRRDF